MNLNLDNIQPQQFLQATDTPPINPIQGDTYYNTRYNVLCIFINQRWTVMNTGPSILGIMTENDRAKILHHKDYFSSKMLLIFNTPYEIHKDFFYKASGLLTAIKNLGVEILWHNEFGNVHGLICAFVENIEDCNLIRISYSELIRTIIPGSTVIEDLQA